MVWSARPPPLCQPRLCNGRQSFDSIHSTRLQVARDGHGRTAPARVVLSGRGVVTEWRVHACGESRRVPDCRSVQHDALKPERLGLLCGSESEAHGAQVSALRAARLRRPRRLSRALAVSELRVSRTDGRRGAPKSYIPPQRSNRAFPMPQHDSPKDRVLGLCNLPPEIFVTKALNQVARAPTPSVKRQAAHTQLHTHGSNMCVVRAPLSA